MSDLRPVCSMCDGAGEGDDGYGEGVPTTCPRCGGSGFDPETNVQEDRLSLRRSKHDRSLAHKKAACAPITLKTLAAWRQRTEVGGNLGKYATLALITAHERLLRHSEAQANIERVRVEGHMTPLRLARLFLPGVDDGLLDHLLWNETCFPMGSIEQWGIQLRQRGLEAWLQGGGALPVSGAVLEMVREEAERASMAQP